MKKKLLSMLLVVMAVTMVGCGKKDETTNVEPKPGQMTAEEILASANSGVNFDNIENMTEIKVESTAPVVDPEAEAAAAREAELAKMISVNEWYEDYEDCAMDLGAYGITIEEADDFVRSYVDSGEFESFGKASEDLQKVCTECYGDRPISVYTALCQIMEGYLNYIPHKSFAEANPELVAQTEAKAAQTLEPEVVYDEHDKNKDGVVSYKDANNGDVATYAGHFTKAGLAKSNADALPLIAEHFDAAWETGKFNTPNDVLIYFCTLDGVYDPEAPLDEAIISKYCNK